jgi:4,5-dihydroxyphthalate decarboxylase
VSKEERVGEEPCGQPPSSRERRVMAALRLTTAMTQVAHHAALLDGRVSIPGVELIPADIGSSYPDVFRRMCRDQEFDVCELSVMSYYCARQYGLRFSAIPVVPRHQFHHADFQVNSRAGISEPKDLEGKRVGARSYTVTPGVLDRGILADEYDVDLDLITWVLAEAEHVAASEDHYPVNVVPGTGGDLFERLVSGDLDAGIAGANQRRRPSPEIVPLFADPEALDRRQYERTGIVPVFTCIVIKTELLDQHSWLGEALFDGFVAARSFGIQPDPVVARIAADNPVPIGLRDNRASFAELLDLGRRQHILTGAATVDELFAPFDPN